MLPNNNDNKQYCSKRGHHYHANSTTISSQPSFILLTNRRSWLMITFLLLILPILCFDASVALENDKQTVEQAASDLNNLPPADSTGTDRTTNGEGGVSVENGVYVLTSDNFDDFTQQYPYVFIDFYAPWCKHCQHLQPDFERAAQDMKKIVPFTPFAKCDLTAERAIAQRTRIQGFPTLILWKSEKTLENLHYTQYDRRAKDLLNFVRTHTDPGFSAPLIDWEDVFSFEMFPRYFNAALVYIGPVVLLYMLIQSCRKVKKEDKQQSSNAARGPSHQQFQPEPADNQQQEQPTRSLSDLMSSGQRRKDLDNNEDVVGSKKDQ